jgi:hypothetical protein
MSKLDNPSRNGDQRARLTPADVTRLFDDGYSEVEILPDGTLREAPGDVGEQDVTRTLKTKRTWY